MAASLVRAELFNVYRTFRPGCSIRAKERDLRRERDGRRFLSLFFFLLLFLSLSQVRFLFFSFFVSFLHILLSIRERDVPIRDGPPSSSVLRSRSSFVRLLSDDVEPLDDVPVRYDQEEDIDAGGRSGGRRAWFKYQ